MLLPGFLWACCAAFLYVYPLISSRCGVLCSFSVLGVLPAEELSAVEVFWRINGGRTCKDEQVEGDEEDDVDANQYEVGLEAERAPFPLSDNGAHRVLKKIHFLLLCHDYERVIVNVNVMWFISGGIVG